MSLAELREEVIDLLEDELSTIAGGAPVVTIGGNIERSSELFEALGIADLLLYADRDRYRKNLVLSGYGRRYHLRRIRDEGANTEYRAISRSQAFTDTLAARHSALAAEIVTLSPRAWVAEGEYEEDYCYHQFLHDFALAPLSADTAGLGGLLDRAEGALEGADDPRVQICRAFLDRAGSSFLEAFDELLNLRERWVADNEVLLAHDPAFQIQSRLFVEGLALLDIARRVGFQTEPEYRYCPSVATLGESTQWPTDLYLEVDRIAAEEREQRASEPDAWTPP
jgi:hypothetical protein